ncbi:MAG: flavin reductase [Lachnospiraceae bacterium]|nr:flavin reductase [Lachnospiraceae bacterium]
MFIERKTTELTDNVFDLIGKQWLLVTAARPDGTCNTMTASWGGLGVMWGKDIAFLVIRPQRYTKEFIDSSDTLSISVLPDGYKKQYGYLGSVSGRDEDKITKAGLTVTRDGDTPYFEEARIAMICKKLFAQPYDPDSFLDQNVKEDCYPQKDYHTLYICEIEKVLVKE